MTELVQEGNNIEYNKKYNMLKITEIDRNVNANILGFI